MPVMHCKQALSITGFLILIVISANLITARVMKTDNGVPQVNNTMTNGNSITGDDDKHLQKYLEGAGHELTDMDYTPVRRKPPIHN
ncbi:hypothetical protein MKX01_019807 [Papaver californicum]|nr:hypothetical protein MKX01_019807 [Papaver californicum]